MRVRALPAAFGRRRETLPNRELPATADSAERRGNREGRRAKCRGRGVMRGRPVGDVPGAASPALEIDRGGTRPPMRAVGRCRRGATPGRAERGAAPDPQSGASGRPAETGARSASMPRSRCSTFTGDSRRDRRPRVDRCLQQSAIERHPLAPGRCSSGTARSSRAPLRRASRPARVVDQPADRRRSTARSRRTARAVRACTSVRMAGTPPALVATTGQPLAKASSTDDGMLSMSGVCR